MELAAYTVLGALFLIALSYACVRAGSLAHFRTKLEFLAKLKQGEHINGKEK